MVNQELSKIFLEIASFLDALEVEFKPAAYRRAALAIEGLEEDAADIYKRGGLKELEDIPGVGISIAQKIEEYISSGKIDYHEELKRQLPVDLTELTSVQGIGPRRAKMLFRELKIKNLEDLEKAAREHKIAELEGFGETSEKNILQGIEFRKNSRGRFLLGEALPLAEEILGRLSGIKEVETADAVGSLRRRKETIGDIDILAIVKPAAGAKGAAAVMDFFTTMPGVEKIWGKGDTKSAVRMAGGFNVDLRVLPPESYGAAKQYFTGSKEHNIAVRRLAQERGLKLSEYGLFKGAKFVAGRNEKEIYEYLGMEYVEPELRENAGEVEAALVKKLPRLVGYGDLLGDLHCHSDWDGGQNSIEEIVESAKRRGYHYVGIADHTKFLRIENGLDEKRLAERNAYIDKLNRLLEKDGGDFHILKGCEANIMPDGSIDIDDKALAQLDFVIAGVHSSFSLDKEKMTRRLIKAMENPNVDIISHPTGRLLMRRAEYQIDFEAVCAAAKRTGTILEINSYPDRLDLNDQHIRYAKEQGVLMAINTDAHQTGQMRFAEYGIAQARRGWAEKPDIINTYPFKKLLEKLKQS